MITIVIDSKTPHRAKLCGANAGTIKVVDRELSFPIKNQFWIGRARGFFGDGRRHLYSKVTGNFPSSLLPFVTKKLKALKKKFEVVDARKFGLCAKVRPDMLSGVTLAAHQLASIKAAVANRGGIMRVATNGGKTEIACGFLKSVGIKNVLWVVPSKGLLTQTINRIKTRLGVDAGRIGGGKWDPRQITVAVSNSLIIHGRKGAVARLKMKRLAVFKKSVRVFIGDEIHHGGAVSWYRSLTNCPALYRLGLSGTPLDRSDGKSRMVEALCGPVVARVTSKELIDIGWSARTTVTIHEVTTPELDDNLPWQEAYKHGIVENDDRNMKIARLALDAVNNKEPVLILCRQIDHVKLIGVCLESLGMVDTQDFELCWAHRFDRMERFKSGAVDILVASPVMGEGIDLPGERIRVQINAQGFQSTILTLQFVGRGQRKKETGENAVRIHDFADLVHPDLSNHSLKRIQSYEAEQYPITMEAA